MTDAGDVIENAIGKNNEEQNVSLWLDTGFPPLNKALSGSFYGGMPVTRIVEMFGPESSGKTAIATQVMIEAQQAGGIAMFMDHEHSFDAHLGEELGLSLSRNNWVYQTPETFEDSVTKVIKASQAIREANLIDDDAPIVAVFDSLAAMVPQSKMAKEITKQGMNDSLALAKATSAVFPTMTLYASKFNMLILILNQEREKPGVMFGDPRTTPGGRAPKFYSSIRVQIGRTMIKNADKDVIGQEVTCKVIKNKVAKPFEKASWRFMFREDGTGFFDKVGSMIDYLTENGLLEVKSKRIQFEGGKFTKNQMIAKINKEDRYQDLVDMLPDEEVEVEEE